jgi:hypothetical protein
MQVLIEVIFCVSVQKAAPTYDRSTLVMRVRLDSLSVALAHSEQRVPGLADSFITYQKDLEHTINGSIHSLAPAPVNSVQPNPITTIIKHLLQQQTQPPVRTQSSGVESSRSPGLSQSAEAVVEAYKV